MTTSSRKTLIVTDSFSWLDIVGAHLTERGLVIGQHVDVGISCRFYRQPLTEERHRINQWFKGLKGNEYEGAGPVAYDVSNTRLADQYSAILSLHCKQIFCKGLTEQTCCYNIHPGLLPRWRGWAPVTFARLAGGPAGATLHRIDGEIDRGKIIELHEVPYCFEDVCIDIWTQVRRAEIGLFQRYFMDIHKGKIVPGAGCEAVQAFSAQEPGPLRTKAEYEKLRKLDVNEQTTVGQLIHRLAATTVGTSESDCYIVDRLGDRIYINISMRRERQ